MSDSQFRLFFWACVTAIFLCGMLAGWALTA